MVDICNGKRGDSFVPASSLPLNAGGGEHSYEEEGEERAHMGARATMGAWEHGSSWELSHGSLLETDIMYKRP